MGKKNDDNGLGGKIISVLFILILAGGIYFLFTLFKSVDITPANIAGNWQQAGSPKFFLTINADATETSVGSGAWTDGTASSYEQFASGDRRNDATYTYSLRANDKGVMVLTLKNTKTKEEEEIKVTRVSNAQIDVIRHGNSFEKFTTLNLF